MVVALRLDFDALEWQPLLPGARAKVHREWAMQLHLVEFTPEFVEPHWCEKGHQTDDRCDIVPNKAMRRNVQQRHWRCSPLASFGVGRHRLRTPRFDRHSRCTNMEASA